MADFIVSGNVTISLWTRVNGVADEKEALKEAARRGPMTLCHHCASSDRAEEEFVTTGEFDGTLEGLEVERAG